MPHYEKGDYFATVTAQGFDVSAEKKTPYFFLQFDPVEACGPNRLPDKIFSRNIKWYVTEKTVERVIEDLRGLGWEGRKISDLDPTVDGHHSFVGDRIKVTCQHEGEYDRFQLFYDGGAKPAESKPGVAAKLDKLFGKAFSTTAPKTPAKPKTTVPPDSEEDDEIPF